MPTSTPGRLPTLRHRLYIRRKDRPILAHLCLALPEDRHIYLFIHPPALRRSIGYTLKDDR